MSKVDLNSIIDPNSDVDALQQYEEWKQNASKEESPCATIFLLGDLKVVFCHILWPIPWLSDGRLALFFCSVCSGRMRASRGS